MLGTSVCKEHGGSADSFKKCPWCLELQVGVLRTHLANAVLGYCKFCDIGGDATKQNHDEGCEVGKLLQSNDKSISKTWKRTTCPECGERFDGYDFGIRMKCDPCRTKSNDLRSENDLRYWCQSVTGTDGCVRCTKAKGHEGVHFDGELISWEGKPNDEYYEIISGYTGDIIGVTVGEDGKDDVRHGEPKAIFRRITKEQYDAYA